MIFNKSNGRRILILVFLNLKLLGAQVSTTNNNEGNLPTSVEPRFLDHGALGFPNFGSGRFGNPTSNYPSNSFFPYGNQNNNIQQPQTGLGYPNQRNVQNRPGQGYGQGYPNQQVYPIQQGYPNQLGYPNQPGYSNQPGYPNLQGYPNQQGNPNGQGYPYFGDSMNSNPNYQRPQYSSQNFQNRPIDGNYHGRFPYQGGNEYPNYQRPEYFNRPGDEPAMYRPYQNPGGPLNQGGYYNQPEPGQGYPPNSFGYQPVNQYPSPGYMADQGNPNYRPDEVGNLPDANFPDALDQFQPYNPQNPNFEQPGPFQNNNYGTGTQLPNQIGVSGGPSINQYPNPVVPFPGGPDNVPPLVNEPPPSYDQGSVPKDNNTASILGKPVIVPPEPVTTAPDETVFDNSGATP
ncbi:unnamed protein product [Spodoptera exigua]|nr:unnamed protein product [Spodoptera exigua]